LAQAFERVARRDEFLADVACVIDFHQLTHDGGIIDFLTFVEFASAWIAGRVDVANDVAVLFDSPQNIAVHDLHVVYVEKQFQAALALPTSSGFALKAMEP